MLEDRQKCAVEMIKSLQRKKKKGHEWALEGNNCRKKSNANQQTY